MCATYCQYEVLHKEAFFNQRKKSKFSLTKFQHKLLYTISNNIEVYEESVPRTKKIPHCAVKFEAGEENRIVHVYRSLYWTNWGIQFNPIVEKLDWLFSTEHSYLTGTLGEKVSVPMASKTVQFTARRVKVALWLSLHRHSTLKGQTGHNSFCPKLWLMFNTHRSVNRRTLFLLSVCTTDSC